MIHLLQLTPSIAFAADGVTSTAAAIAGCASSRFGWRLSIGTPNRKTAAPLHDAVAFAEAIRNQSPDLVLLHYVNYGYDSHGCPDWLVEGIECWRGESPRATLCTYFHEVFATAPPWRRTFWVSRQQKHLASRLAAASDQCIVSLPLYGELLRGLGCQAPIAVRPIVSSVGELEHPAIFEARDRSMVIFGSAGLRARTYGQHRRQLGRACEILEVETVIDIGPEIPTPADVAGRPVQVFGCLPWERVSSILSVARCGFLAYPLDFLEKSSVFAAYCAHGVLPVCAGKARGVAGAPIAGEHFWAADLGPERQEPSMIAAAASQWYQGHSLPLLCDLLTHCLPRP